MPATKRVFFRTDVAERLDAVARGSEGAEKQRAALWIAHAIMHGRLSLDTQSALRAADMAVMGKMLERVASECRAVADVSPWLQRNAQIMVRLAKSG